MLQLGPVDAQFLGKVQIEVPYVASLKGGVREIAILKCDNAAKGHWVPHHQEEDIIGEATPDDLDDFEDEDKLGQPPPPLLLKASC